MKNKIKNNNIVIYQTPKGSLELRGDKRHDTIWATQSDIASLFDIDQSVVSRHASKIFKLREIDLKSNMQKMHIANSDKPTTFYSLDVILGIGYRTNSARAINFRKWANKILKKHITEGYTINPKQLANNYEAFVKTISDVQIVLSGTKTNDTDNILELIKAFASTWFSLGSYDKGSLLSRGTTKKKVKLNSQELIAGIISLKTELMKKGEASELFAVERNKELVEGIFGNIMQSFSGQDLYPSIEDKAAHLFYFMIKNHPFVDGNKRSGAFAFIWFLRKTGVNMFRITPEVLTALALLIAKSEPKEKDRLVALVILLLKS